MTWWWRRKNEVRITQYNYKRVTIDIEYDEVGEMLNSKEEPLNEFAGLLNQYHTWIADCKRIDTKRRLQIPLKLGD